MKQQRERGSRASDLGNLDDLLQHRTRIAAVVLLSRHDQLSFSRLKELLDETDGNLGAHLRRLEDVGYLAAHKEFQERRPVTWYRLTSKGRKALASHLDGLGRLIRHAGRAGEAGE
jgi:DNA-binding MarR family transcriptional regulator